MGKHVHAAMVASRQKKPLRVVLRSGLVTDVEAMAAGIRKFVGVSMEARQGHEDYGKLMTTDLVVEVPGTEHYLRNIFEGHLAGADEDSAKRGAAWGGRAADWSDFLATPEELELAKAAQNTIDGEDAKNMAALVRKKAVVAPKNPVPDPTKLVSTVTNLAGSEGKKPGSEGDAPAAPKPAT